MRVNIGSPVVRTDGRAYGHVITRAGGAPLLYLSFHLQVNCAFAFPFNEFYSGKFLFLQSPVFCIKYNKEYKNHYYACPVNK